MKIQVEEKPTKKKISKAKIQVEEEVTKKNLRPKYLQEKKYQSQKQEIQS